MTKYAHKTQLSFYTVRHYTLMSALRCYVILSRYPFEKDNYPHNNSGFSGSKNKNSLDIPTFIVDPFFNISNYDFQVLDVRCLRGKLSVVVSKIHSKALCTVTTVNSYGMNLFTSNWTQRVTKQHI